MENKDTLKEILKMNMKAKLGSIVSGSLEKHSAELNKFIQEATDNVANKVLDEAKIEEIAKAAQQGATYVAINTLVRQTAQDAIREAEPFLRQVTEEFGKIVAEATSEAIIELILERLLAKLQ